MDNLTTLKLRTAVHQKMLLGKWKGKSQTGRYWQKYSWHRILFSHQVEWSPETCYSMAEPLKHAKSKQADTKGHVTWSHSYKTSRRGRAVGTASGLLAARGSGQTELGDRRCLLGDRNWFWKWTVVMVVQCCEYAENHWIVRFNPVKKYLTKNLPEKNS